MLKSSTTVLDRLNRQTADLYSASFASKGGTAHHVEHEGLIGRLENCTLLWRARRTVAYPMSFSGNGDMRGGFRENR